MKEFDKVHNAEAEVVCQEGITAGNSKSQNDERTRKD